MTAAGHVTILSADLVIGTVEDPVINPARRIRRINRLVCGDHPFSTAPEVNSHGRQMTAGPPHSVSIQVSPQPATSYAITHPSGFVPAGRGELF